MKQGKRPTKNQKKMIIEAGLHPAHWLIVKNQDHRMELVHRDGSRTEVINR
ncbi:DUF6906 family protein [Niallia sp. 03190]|uniref:DUF6906 family protein n=1 Tax=Niallia sp. 03190 TaxID=3458061 RepID=UPI004045058E